MLNLAAKYYKHLLNMSSLKPRVDVLFDHVFGNYI